MKIYKINNRVAIKKARYVGNCTDIFDRSSGECLIDIFRDVSDFGCKEEDLREQIEDGRETVLSLDEFSNIVDIDCLMGKDLSGFEFYFYSESEFSNQIYVAYDKLSDIHYFFV